MTSLSVNLKKAQNPKKKLTAILFFIFLPFFACQPASQESLTIAVAANMQFAIGPLVDEFETSTGIECEVILGSSGKLTAQIAAGAPYDILLSADLSYPQSLENDRLTRGNTRVYAYGRLIAWSLSEVPPADLLQWITELSENEKVAVANPRTAPYGRAAIEVLKNLGKYEEMEALLVYGESVAQVNQFITSKSARFGFTTKSIVMAPNFKGQGSWLPIKPSQHSPIAQGVVALNSHETMQEEADRFLDFLFSAEAQEILHKFGYATTQE